MKRFEYRQALNAALKSNNPEIILSLIEELVERDALCIAIGNRDEEEVVKLFDFLIWKLPDHRYTQVLLEVARLSLDMYSGVIGLSDKFDNKLFNQMNLMVNDQVTLQKGLLELSGQIELVTRLASLKRL